MLKRFELFVFVFFFYALFITFFFDENLYYVGLVSLFCLPSFEGVFFKEDKASFFSDFSSVVASFLENGFYCSEIFSNLVKGFMLELYFLICFLNFYLYYIYFYLWLQSILIFEKTKKNRI